MPLQRAVVSSDALNVYRVDITDAPRSILVVR